MKTTVVPKYEKEVEHYLVEEIRRRGGAAIKFKDPKTTGAPDRLVLLSKGRAMFVEVKKPEEQPRPDQVYYMKNLELLGFKCYVVSKRIHVDELIQIYFP